jgi:S-adenosylmethionine hydrolase
MAVVTFTSDFGPADGYAAAMKGVVLSLAPDAVLVDISHAIPRHDIAAGALALAQAAPFFPSGSVHVAVVDPGVGSERAPMVVETAAGVFVGPDNGV